MTEKLPFVPAKHSYKVEVKAGNNYFWCSCGASKNQPFCDGQHKNFKDENDQPLMKPVLYKATEDKIVSFCGCKNSQKGALCDGSHKSL